MNKSFIAVTYDVCDHQSLYESMNEYRLDFHVEINEQVKELAAMDVAPLIKVYVSNLGDNTGFKFYKEYKFKEYECNCNS